MNSNLSYSPETLNSGQNQWLFAPFDLEIWWRTLKNNGTPFLYYIKLLCIISKPWVDSNWSYFPETLNSGQNRVTLKFDGWPRKTIRHIFYAPSSFVHHFVAISVFKLEVQSGSDQFGSKSTICFSRVTLKFDRWPWKTIGHLFLATSSFLQHFVAIGELELQSENAQFGSKSTIF